MPKFLALGSRVFKGCAGLWALNALFVACSAPASRGSFSQNPTEQAQLLSFRAVRDTVLAKRDTSTVEASVAFVVRNTSRKAIYGMRECGESPLYWAERRETDSAGAARWRQVFSAGCTGRLPPRELTSGDSALVISPIVQFPGQWPPFAFSDHPDFFRIVYVVSVEGDSGKRQLRIVSPSVVIRVP